MLSVASVIALLTLLTSPLCIAPVDAYRYTVFVPSSTTWSPPVGATDLSVTLWGGGGGAASTSACAGSGGSGATILNRTVDASSWGVALSDVQWQVVVGLGGAGFVPAIPPTAEGNRGNGGNGGTSIFRALHPNGTVLTEIKAYGGGGGSGDSQSIAQGPTCLGGGGGGASSSAVGTIPGSGVPSGGVNTSPYDPAQEGALVGDIKAGGSGTGADYYQGFDTSPHRQGANWTVGSRHFLGGQGQIMPGGLVSWGGAAGYNGNGGGGNVDAPSFSALANSGAGGGTAYVLYPYKYGTDGSGGSGGAIIEYSHSVAPSPSPTPTRTPTPSATPTPTRTPSPSPTPSSQPLTQTGVWFISPVNDKNLTPQDDGSVRSLWYDPSYHSKWTVARLSNGKYTLKSTNKNCYLTGHAASPDGYVRCESTTPGTNGQWTILIGPDDQWTFKSVHGTYMGTTAGGVIYLNQNSGLYWTKYSSA
jgi:hypothetical protein